MTRILPWLVPAAALVAVAIGVVLTLQPLQFTWVTYSPISLNHNGPVYMNPISSPPHVIGGVLVLVGIVLVAGWVGYLLGRRRRTARSGAEPS